MFFRRAKREPTRADRWEELAQRLELEDAVDRAERIGRNLALDGATLGPMFALRRDGQPSLYLFDLERGWKGPAGGVAKRGSGALLRARRPFVETGFRAIPKGHAVVERIEAGRSGGAAVHVAADDAFEEHVTVFSREPDEGAALLTPPVRSILRRTLDATGMDRVMVGERHILCLREREALAMDGLERLASDVLSLYAALVSQRRVAVADGAESDATEF